MSNQYKRCVKCNELKSIDEFWKNKKKIDGIDNRCKACLTKARRKSNQNYYQKNKEKINKYSIEWKRKNKDKVVEARKRYHERNSEKIREKGKEYKKENREKINQYKKLQRNEQKKKEQRKELIRLVFRDRIRTNKILNHKDKDR